MLQSITAPVIIILQLNIVKLPSNKNYYIASNFWSSNNLQLNKQFYTCIKVIQKRLTNNKDTVLDLYQSDTRKYTQRITTQNPKKLFS